MRISIPRSEPTRLALAACLAASLPGCADSIGRADLLRQIEAGTAPPIVDVRSLAEYTAGHVAGAVHIPFYSMLSEINRVPAPREEGRPVVVYCEHGPRAGIARAALWIASDHPVRFLEGHMTAWKQDGLPVETATSDPGQTE